MFHVGQHVVCVDDVGWVSSEYHPVLPKKGFVYVVSETIISPFNGALGLCFVGIPTGIHPTCGLPCAFRSERFRPLSESRLDVFRQLLVSPKERVGA